MLAANINRTYNNKCICIKNADVGYDTGLEYETGKWYKYNVIRTEEVTLSGEKKHVNLMIVSVEDNKDFSFYEDLFCEHFMSQSEYRGEVINEIING